MPSKSLKRDRFSEGWPMQDHTVKNIKHHHDIDMGMGEDNRLIFRIRGD